MTVNTIKFSQFAAGSLTNTTNMLVGVTASSGGTNFKVPFPLSWTTASRPSSPGNGVLGYNTSLSQYEYWNGGAWVQLAAGGSGTVNVGDENQLGYYATTGTAISALSNADNAVLLSNAAGLPVWTAAIASGLLISTSGSVPQWSTSLPVGINLPQPNIIGVTNGSNAAAGSVGEYISSEILSGSAISLTTNTPMNVTSIALTAGDWDISSNVAYIGGSGVQILYTQSAINTISDTFPDPAFTTVSQPNGPAASTNAGDCISTQRLNISSPVTVYLLADAQFSVSTLAACGFIGARRVR